MEAKLRAQEAAEALGRATQEQDAGDLAKARELFQAVAMKYPNTPAATVARGRLEQVDRAEKEKREAQATAEYQAAIAAEKTTGAIAFGAYSDALTHNVNILKINGKSASNANYPYNGKLSLIFKAKNNRGNIKKFVDFALSSSAHKAIRQTGGIPMK